MLDKASNGERQVVFVTGEVGIGKTTLIDTFLAQIRDRADIRITSGQCVEQYGPGEAYMPLLEATTRLCRGPARKRRIEGLKRYAPSWLVQLPGLLDSENRTLLQQRVQGAKRERMLREMAETVELFTTTRALVLVLEDLHWSDVSTLDWVSYMARRREPAKLLILGTYRPTDALASNHPLHKAVQELQAQGQCEELRLTPLAEEAIGEYLTVRLKADVRARHTVPLQQLTPRLHRRTGGNPLFIVNTVDDLIRQGVLTEDAGQWTLRAETAEALCESVPDSLRQLVDRQLERLPEPEQRLLEAASVVGVEFAAAEVAAGLLTDSEEVETRCEQLARAGQWVRETGIAEWPDGTLSGRYSFRHALYREVVYARVAEPRRLQLHRRIAERKALAYGERAREIAAELAVHFEAGREYSKAVQYHRQAGEAAARRNAHQEALSHLKRGLDLLTLLPDGPERMQQEVRLQLALANSLYAIGGRIALQEMERAFLRAYELCQQCGESPQLATILFGLCMVYELRGEVQKGLVLAEQLLTLAQKTQKPVLLLQAHMALGDGLYFLGDFTASHYHFEQALTVYDPNKHNPRVSNIAQDLGAYSLSRAGWGLWCLGYPEQARRSCDKGLTLARELSHFLSEAFALKGAIGVAQQCGELSTVERYVERMVTLSQEQGCPYYVLWGRIIRGWLLTVQGNGAEGIAQLRQGIDSLRKGGLEVELLYFMGLLAEAYGIANQAEEGLTVLTEALAIAEQRGERFYEAELYRLKGTLTLQAKVQGLKSKVEEEAEEYFERAIEVARKQQAKSLELRAVMSLSRLWQKQGKKDEARQMLAEIYGWFTEGFDTKDLHEAAMLLHELGDSEKRRGETQKVQQVEGVRLQSEGSAQFSPCRLQPVASSLSDSVISPQTLSTPASRPQLPTPNTFRPEGEYWTVSFAGTTCRLKEARGLHYIARLLHQPHQEVHVISLITTSAGLSEEHSLQDSSLPFDHTEGDTGELLDPQARAAYKQRVSELREELAEAQQFHDLGRSERLSAELDFLSHELASAVGLGGRARRMGSPAERARVNVTRAVKIALRKISEHHATLGRHLASTIKTGTYCSYTPDARMPIAWLA